MGKTPTDLKGKIVYNYALKEKFWARLKFDGFSSLSAVFGKSSRDHMLGVYNNKLVSGRETGKITSYEHADQTGEWGADLFYDAYDLWLLAREAAFVMNKVALRHPKEDQTLLGAFEAALRECENHYDKLVIGQLEPVSPKLPEPQKPEPWSIRQGRTADFIVEKKAAVQQRVSKIKSKLGF